MTNHEPSVLFIAYHFPPSAAVGGQRISRLASAVRSFGWRSEVLTIADEDVELVDPDRLKDVDGIAVHKARALPTMLDLLTVLRKQLRRTTGAPGDAGGPPAESPAIGGNVPGGGLRRFAMSMLMLPDGERGWLVPATIKAVRTIRRDHIGWFMTSCPPYTVHLVGLAVKALTGARWAADFRDPWMTTGSKRLYPTSALSLRIERWLERKVVENADLVVFNVDRLKNAYRQRYVHVRQDKFVFIPNGVVRRPDSDGARKYDIFTISYTGSLYVGRSPEPVMAAVSQLIRERRVATDAIKMKLVGHCRVIDGTPTTAVIRRLGLESVVEVADPIPYEDAFDLVRRSHLALLLAPNLPYQIPAKVYDYLGAGTRILAIAEEGGTSDLLAETASGRAFRAEEVAEIADYIEAELKRNLTSRESNRHSARVDRYDVRRTTEDLVAHFARVAAMPAGSMSS